MKKVLFLAFAALSTQVNAHSLIIKTNDTATLSGKVGVELNIRGDIAQKYTISTDSGKVGVTPTLKGGRVNNKINVIIKSKVENEWEKRTICATPVKPADYKGIIPTVCGIIKTKWVVK